MVKKIKIIEEDHDDNDAMTPEEFQETLIEYIKSIDWKLWELLKIAQAHHNDKQKKAKQQSKNNNDFSSIIVDEDELDDDDL